MPKVTVTNTRGLVQEAGSGIEFEHAPKLRTKTIVGGTTGSCQAFNIMSGTSMGNGGGGMARLPSLADSIGQNFFFRNSSTRIGAAQKSKTGANILTGSASDVNADLFVWASSSVDQDGGSGPPGGVTSGQRVQLGNDVGDCLKITSDGNAFYLFSLTGSHVIVVNNNSD